MGHDLSNLKPPSGSRHRKVRVGRGIGSKLPKTAGRGNKGQKSRSGFASRPGFEGGQMPLHRRIPKRGFHNPTTKVFSVVNISALNVFSAGETVTPDSLRNSGLIRKATGEVKILGEGDIKVALTVQAHAFSGSAREKITAAGGKAELVQ
ncbi:MAG TPA: 50S ribosomal protein L15 [Candidatus Acidoferrum sp.]|nr:50S ribosomal protein L15 [Candidatus Acidoferrum sp.]